MEPHEKMSTMKAEVVKAVSRVTTTWSNWPIWNPEGREAHMCLGGVIVTLVENRAMVRPFSTGLNHNRY